MKKIFPPKGFTLVEMLVAVSIFASVIAVAGGVFVGFVGKQRVQLRQYALQQDIFNFFDILDREIRTGYGDTFTQPGNDVTKLRFYNQSQNNKVDPSQNMFSNYWLENKTIQYRLGSDTIDNEQITSNNTNIEALKFTISNGTLSAVNGDLVGSPMRVTISLKACPKDGALSECITAQTTVACRQTLPHLSNIP